MASKLTYVVGQGFDKNGNTIVSLGSKLKTAKLETAKLFGGYSLTQNMGGWVNSQGKLVQEPSITLTVFTTDVDVDVWNDHAKYLAGLFNQESVLLAVQTVDSLAFVGQ